MLKKINMSSSKDIKELLGKKVYLSENAPEFAASAKVI